MMLHKKGLLLWSLSILKLVLKLVFLECDQVYHLCLVWIEQWVHSVLMVRDLQILLELWLLELTIM